MMIYDWFMFGLDIGKCHLEQWQVFRRVWAQSWGWHHPHAISTHMVLASLPSFHFRDHHYELKLLTDHLNDLCFSPRSPSVHEMLILLFNIFHVLAKQPFKTHAEWESKLPGSRAFQMIENKPPGLLPFPFHRVTATAMEARFHREVNMHCTCLVSMYPFECFTSSSW